MLELLRSHSLTLLASGPQTTGGPGWPGGFTLAWSGRARLNMVWWQGRLGRLGMVGMVVYLTQGLPAM